MKSNDIIIIGIVCFFLGLILATLLQLSYDMREPLLGEPTTIEEIG